MKLLVLLSVSLLTLFASRVEAQSEWRTLKHGEDSITSVRFTPNGKHLVSASFNGTVVLWDVKAGKQIWKHYFDSGGSEGNYTVSHVLAMELSPDGCTIAASYTHSYVVNNRLKKGDDDRISLLDVKDGREQRVLVGSSARALRLNFSPDGRLLASGGPDGVTRLWDVGTGQQVREIRSPRGISALSFSHDGKMLAVGQASPNSIQLATAPHLLLFNVDSGELVQKLRVEGSYVNDASFSPNGELLAVVGRLPDEITLLRSGTWQLVRSLKNPEVNADRISFSSDGRWLASGEAGNDGGRVFVWEAATDGKPRSIALSSGVEAINFSPDASTLAAGTEDGKIMLLRF
jgi:WD40 repeat protein